MNAARSGAVEALARLAPALPADVRRTLAAAARRDAADLERLAVRLEAGPHPPAARDTAGARYLGDVPAAPAAATTTTPAAPPEAAE